MRTELGTAVLEHEETNDPVLIDALGRALDRDTA